MGSPGCRKTPNRCCKNRQQAKTPMNKSFLALERGGAILYCGKKQQYRKKQRAPIFPAGAEPASNQKG